MRRFIRVVSRRRPHRVDPVSDAPGRNRGVLLPLRLAVVALPWFIFGNAAQADSLDSWNIVAGTSVTHDDNLFRLPSSADTRSVLGSSSKSDTITAATVGIKVNKRYSLQRFELDANLVRYDYKTFDYLDFTARNYAAAWRWSLTPALTGNLTASRQESLNSFTDNRNFRTQNVRTDENRRFDADYDLGAGWHLLGGVFETVRKNSETFVQESDNTITSAEIGGRYVFTSGSNITFLNRTGRGTYDSRPLSVVNQFDNEFDQTENLLSMRWPVTAKTTLNARIGRFERKHDNFPARNFSGPVGMLGVDWEVSAKTRITGGFQRDLWSYETRYSSYVEADRYFVAPIWQISAKTALRLRYDYLRFDYRGAIVEGLPARKDSERIGLIAVDWKAMNSLTVTASLVSDRRSSSLPGSDFKDTTAIVSAQLSF